MNLLYTMVRSNKEPASVPNLEGDVELAVCDGLWPTMYRGALMDAPSAGMRMEGFRWHP